MLYPFFKKVKSSPLGYRLLKGAFWSVSGSVVTRLLTLILAIVIARLIGKKEFGELGIIQATVGMIGAFAAFGMDTTTAKYVAEFRKKDPDKAGRIIRLAVIVSFVVGGAMSLLFFFIAPWIATDVLAAHHLKGFLQIGSILLFCGAVNSAQTGALSGFESFKVIMKINVIAGSLTFVLTLVGVLLFGLTGVVYALVLSMLINLLLNYFFLGVVSRKMGVCLQSQNFFQEWRVIIHFSFPAVLGGVLVGFVNWYCSTLLIHQPHGYEEMGVYNAANQWRTAILVLPLIINQVITPILSERIGMNDYKSPSNILKYSIITNFLIAAPVIIVGSLLSPVVMGFYGEGFADSWIIFIVVLVTAGLMSIQMPVGQMIVALDKMWIGLFMNLGWGIVLVSCTFLFVNQGALGLVSAQLIAYLVHSTWTFIYAHSVIRNGNIFLKMV